MSLSKTLYPLLSTGSTQEDSKLSCHDLKLVNYEADLKKMLVCRAPTYPPKTGPVF